MKKLLFIVGLLMFFSLTSISHPQMIAEIPHPVQTEFGTYQPFPTAIFPAVELYQVADDFSNVINFNEFRFSEKEKALLKQNHFVVSPRRETEATGYKEIYDVYNEARDLGIPIFVTTDAMLHTFHLIFDRMLMELEQKRFYHDLNHLLDGLLHETMDVQYPATTDDLTKSCLLNTIDYLIVAKTLLDSTYDPQINGGKYLQELTLIQEHQGFTDSPLFGYEEDYSQYIVRGHYTKTDTLRHYFLSMMWLGRMTFAADPQYADAFNQKATLSALLLIQALERLKVSDETAFQLWNRIYSPTVFFVGKSDDNNWLQYRPLIQQFYGENFANLDVNRLKDEPVFTNFLAQAKLLEGPQIKYPGQPQGFRFMGQRFIPDSYILDQVVYNNVPGRFMPKGLDVMAVLGSQQAYHQLEQMGEMQNPAYKTKLDGLIKEFKNYPSAIWAENLYWNWLYSLMPLLFPKGEGYPYFMQQPAWMDKELYAALASWAELRHDTILYAKQSGTERGLPPDAILKQGYVEPNPHFYGRMAALAHFLMDGLAHFGLLYPKFNLHLTNFKDLAINLKTISEKELTNQPLTYQEYLLINNFGLALEAIAEFEKYGGTSGPTPLSQDEMPVIADVHTDANSNLCLEEGVGYPFIIYVLCNIEGQIKITRGAGFSYYEFTHPISDRLTDEAWRKMLQTKAAPLPPAWTSSFLDQDWLNSNPKFYSIQSINSCGLQVNLSQYSAKRGEQITISVQPKNCTLQNSPTLLLEMPGGIHQQYTNFKLTGDTYQMTIETSLLNQGKYLIEVQGTQAEDYQQPLTFRTGFTVQSATGVADAGISKPNNNFWFTQNFPNPFNASTMIRFHLEVDADVLIRIYDTLGREVKTLFMGRQTAGIYELKWNGLDNSGNTMPGGIYFCHLKAGNFSQVRKLILVN
ncbi:DUF3160 domain-containing protein [candidate division KSB1 bacterium]|nr:DUF3160 domain-containing protein [candidate division KSB1 bacterium]